MDITQVKNTNPLISFAAVIVIAFGLQAASVLLVPFLLAVFLALITVRPMLWLQEHRVPSVVAALLIVGSLMMFLGVVGAIVGSSIAEFTAALPAYQARLDAIFQGALEFAARFVEDEEQLTDLGSLVDPGWAMGQAAGILNALRGVMTNTFLILFTMVFILLEASSMSVKMQAAFGTSEQSMRRRSIGQSVIVSKP